jgi:hypothetical protein
VAGVGAAGLLKQARGVSQVAGHDGAEVGGLCEPPAPAFPRGAELGGAQQLGDGADGVAASQVGVGDFLKERGDALVGFCCGFCEVPRVSFRLAGESGGKLGVGASALFAR